MTTPTPPAGDQGQGQQGQGGPTVAELATKVDGLADQVQALINVVGSKGGGSAPASGGSAPAAGDAHAAAADLQTQIQAELKKVHEQEAREAQARGEKDWRAKVDAFMERAPEVAPVEPQRGLRGLVQRGLIGTPRQQREAAPAVKTPAAAPPGGGGQR